MSRAVVVRATGGPEVLTLEHYDPGKPGPGEIRLRHEAIGLNFVDVYQRTGLYKAPLPLIPGNEGAGVVTEVGPGVTGFSPGDRVGYTGVSGAYCDERLLPADKAVKLPFGMSSELAATVMMKGGTAHFLLFETWPLKTGDTVLVHAAAGGVGSLLVQWASASGARVFALASTPEKLAQARANGAEAAFNSETEDWVALVRAATGGRGVDVVYDGVGQATFMRSLDCLRPRGLMVSFGNASGPVTGINLAMLQTRGSLYVTRPTTAHYFGDRLGLERTMEAVFVGIAAGKIRPAVQQRFALADVAAAHRALEARATTGATILVP